MQVERIPYDRLSAVDLRGLTEEQLTALRQEAIHRRISMPELLGQLVDEVSRRFVPQHPTHAKAA